MTRDTTADNSTLKLSSVALGCWPIAGITSVGVSRENSLATIRAAFDAGVTHFDTAHAYGYEGESETMVGEVLRPFRNEVTVATKGGLVWGRPAAEGKRPQRRDGRPEVLIRQCDESLKRLGFETIDLYYLHAPDPNVPIAEQAAAMRSLQTSGKVQHVGVSNFDSIAQYDEFAAECPIAADQQPYNMLQRDIERTVMPWTRSRSIPTTVYWPLMKGLLAGKIGRDHVFESSDSRPGYPIFQGELRRLAHDVVDRLFNVSSSKGITVAQLVVAWTAAQPGIGAVLCGAKRPEQIVETAAAMSVHLAPSDFAEIESACKSYLDYA